MRGIILAGGNGTRLHPLTISVSKQLLPVYNKPMIYYPLGTLLLAGVRKLMIVTSSRDQKQFEALLGNGEDLGIEIQYKFQEQPNGIAEGLLIGEDFLKGYSSCLALGDNIFFGAGVGETLAEYDTHVGATILAKEVTDPSRYGVVEFDAEGKATSLEEKPENPKSNYAVPGLYFFDDTAVDRAKSLRPSKRGELEITDLNHSYLLDRQLNVRVLPRGTAWLDTGTVESLAQASEFVKVVEQRQGLKISCPEEIAWRLGYIDDNQLMRLGDRQAKTDYGQYLLNLLR